MFFPTHVSLSAPAAVRKSFICFYRHWSACGQNLDFLFFFVSMGRGEEGNEVRYGTIYGGKTR